MKNTFALVVAGLALLMAGCTAPTVKYKDDRSYALNVTTYGGLTGLKDVEVEGVNPTIENASSAAIEIPAAISAYNAPPPGLTGLQAGAINVVAWLLKPTPLAKRNHHFAWVPQSLVNDEKSAWKYYQNLLLSAARRVSSELGMETFDDFSHDFSGNALLTKSDKALCEPGIGCFVVFIGTQKKPSKTSNTAEFVNSTKESYFFEPRYRNSIRFSPEFLGFNQYDFMIRMSSYLPEWVYIYTAPNKLHLSKDNIVKAPVLFNQGKAHFFIKPKKQ